MLHKKDFAQMIGVTLSYVYNLIDETIPFSTRTTTVERIATVMDISPEEFVEYKIPQDPILIDEATEFIKEKQKEKNYGKVVVIWTPTYLQPVNPWNFPVFFSFLLWRKYFKS